MPAAQYVKEPCEIRRYFPADFEDHFIPREVGGSPKYRDLQLPTSPLQAKTKTVRKITSGDSDLEVCLGNPISADRIGGLMARVPPGT